MKYQALRIYCCWLLLTVICVNVFAQSKTEQLLLKKNFYFLYLLEQHRIRPAGKVFESLSKRLREDAKKSVESCKDAACFSKAVQFREEEITAVGNELAKQSFRPEWRKLTRKLRASGAYGLFAVDVDSSFIRKAWQQDAMGVNHVLAIYVEGRAPLYPRIDSISFPPKDAGFRNKIAGSIFHQPPKGSLPFYNYPLQLALDAMRLNDRDEAVRYEPLNAKENAAAFKKAALLNWSAFKYSVILVPGLGPETPGVRLDPNGAKRCDSAAVRYRAGLAPFIVVSGGHVHPNKTPFCEAIEMKKYMVEVLKIPASDIIIEPHARHTTTNLRNTNRLVYLFKMPADKPVMIVSDAAQTKYINGNMKQKIQKELGYLPFVSMKQLSSTETEYLPVEISLQINPFDPLDP